MAWLPKMQRNGNSSDEKAIELETLSARIGAKTKDADFN
jgi:hypothetical protein